MALTTSLVMAGNLTADPEIRTGQSGVTFVRFSIAVTSRERDKETNTWKDGEVAFWNCVAFGDLAQHIAGSLRKGNRVIAYGQVKPTSWTDKDSGVKRTDKEFLVEDIGPSLVFAFAKPERPGQAEQQAPARGGEWATPDASYGDDIPF